MPSLMERLRSLFVSTENPEHVAVEERMRQQADRLRMARIDAKLPVERRHRTLSANHPNRRWNDG